MLSEKPVQIITCESPEEWLWDQFLFLQNEEAARRFLARSYQNQGIHHPERVAFRNAQPFMAYVRQALSIFPSLQAINLWMQPILLYYGITSLVKALILTRIPDYPQSTSVLRHGLSTRKRKKEPYRFVRDEVRVQKEGLFPLVARLLGHCLPAGETFPIQDLFALLPDLSAAYQQLFGKVNMLPVSILSENAAVSQLGVRLAIPEQALDLLHLSPAAFTDKLNQYSKLPLFSLANPPVEKGQLQLIWFHPAVRHVHDWPHGFAHPWFREDKKGDYYLWLGNNRPIDPIDELLVHFILAFSLGMLCRYEPPIWEEIIMEPIHEEQVLIRQFLRLAPRKFPQLILSNLHLQKWVLRLY